MPELPEVETMRRGLLPIVGRQVVDAQKLACPRKPILISPRIDHLRRRLVGQTIDRIDRVGKRVAVVFAAGDRLIVEPRMTGLVLLSSPPDPLYLRFRLCLAGQKPDSLYYWDRRGLGSVRLLSANEFRAQFGPAKLGPDALQMTAEQYRDRLSRSRRAIKVALLDQTVVAGIGNLYAAELLFVAGVHPAKRCDLVTRHQ